MGSKPLPDMLYGLKRTNVVRGLLLAFDSRLQAFINGDEKGKCDYFDVDNIKKKID